MELLLGMGLGAGLGSDFHSKEIISAMQSSVYPKLKVFTFTSCRPRAVEKNLFSIINSGEFHHCTTLAYALQDIRYACREIDIPLPYRRLIAATTEAGPEVIQAFYSADIYSPDDIIEGMRQSDYIFLELASANAYWSDGFLLYKWQCDKYSSLSEYLDPVAVSILSRLAKKRMDDYQIMRIASLLDRYIKNISPNAQIVLFSHIPHPPLDVSIEPNKSRKRMADLARRISNLLGWHYIDLLKLPEDWIVTEPYDYGLHISRNRLKDFGLVVAKSIFA